MNSEGVQALVRNQDSDFKIASTTLLRIARNILENVEEDKFRSIRIDSKAFQDKILPFDGAVQCLLEMGFQEDGDKFTLFTGTSLADLKEILKQIKSATNLKLAKTFSAELSKSHSEILQRLKAHQQHAVMFENKSLQQKARSVIPIVELNKRTQVRIAEQSNSELANYQYCFLLELLQWFKHEFFTWTDQPKCPTCEESQRTAIGMLSPSQEDLLWGASRVEGYKCNTCNKTIRFPRYNHPEKLLETRTGRCGEWANCFTLICKSMAYDARHVLDWTDHVWTEVFILNLDRWLHCDPCENICDKPLLYEQGWKKQLSLIVAADHEHMVDVTRRYTLDREGVENRRNKMFNSDWLKSIILELNEAKRLSMSSSKKDLLTKRMLNEEKELSSIKLLPDEDLGGRTSGSLAWRTARGETEGEKRKTLVENFKAIKPTDVELKDGKIHIEYSCSSDKYTRISDSKTSHDGWKTFVFRVQDVMRKVEYDWKRAYLCRKENSPMGYIAWQIELPKAYAISVAEIFVADTIFEDGFVKWLVTTDKTSRSIKSGSSEKLELLNTKSRVLSIHAFLRGENWQHSQIFREATGSPSSPSLKLQIEFTRI